MYYRGSAAAIIVYDITKEVRPSAVVFGLFARFSLGCSGLQLLCSVTGDVLHVEELGERASAAWAA